MTNPTNPLDRLIGYQIRRASVAMMARLVRDLSELGLTPTEASVLLLVEANPGITQSEVGRVLNVKRANMAPLTAALDRRSLVQRRPVDGRSHGLELTPSGAALAAEALRSMETHDASIAASLSGERERDLRLILADLWESEVERRD